jgi:hypothetical protein
MPRGRSFSSAGLALRRTSESSAPSRRCGDPSSHAAVGDAAGEDDPGERRSTPPLERPLRGARRAFRSRIDASTRAGNRGKAGECGRRPDVSPPWEGGPPSCGLPLAQGAWRWRGDDDASTRTKPRGVPPLRATHEPRLPLRSIDGIRGCSGAGKARRGEARRGVGKDGFDDSRERDDRTNGTLT